jgi:poly-beta-1,6-N-acetyl-D-glucosamine synthase
MFLFWLTALALVCVYYAWIGMYFYGWLRSSIHDPFSRFHHSRVSVVIPVRNEEADISTVLNDLISQDFPAHLIEILIIDDHSADKTPLIAAEFVQKYPGIKYFKLPENESGKKRALHKGVSVSGSSLILTTDADCRLPPCWIRAMNTCFVRTGADLVAGPLIMEGDDSFLSIFQQLEILSLTGSAAGSFFAGMPVMCSSANLGFRRDAYLEAWDQNFKNISSGDDVFLLHALLNQGNKKLVYLKDADSAVITGVQPKLAGLLSQRIRWASKSRHYKTRASIFTALLVFIIHFATVLCLFIGIFEIRFLHIAAFIFISKSLIDFPFLYSVAKFFRRNKLMNYFGAVQVIYFFYISFTAIASLVGKVTWKERVIRIQF